MKKIVTMGLVLLLFNGFTFAEDAIAVDAEGNIEINPQETLNVNGDMEISGDVRASGNVVSTDPDTISALHYLLNSEVVQLWTGTKGGPHLMDLTSLVPAKAKGAILKVIMASPGRDGSIVFSDRMGALPKAIHYQYNGFTNYASTWIGGTVLVFFVTDENDQVPEDSKQFSFKMISNQEDPDNTISSIGSLIGWF